MAKKETNKHIENINSVIGNCRIVVGMALQEQSLKMVEQDKELYLKAKPFIDAALKSIREQLPMVQAAEDY